MQDVAGSATCDSSTTRLHLCCVWITVYDVRPDNLILWLLKCSPTLYRDWCWRCDRALAAYCKHPCISTISVKAQYSIPASFRLQIESSTPNRYCHGSQPMAARSQSLPMMQRDVDQQYVTRHLDGLTDTCMCIAATRKPWPTHIKDFFQMPAKTRDNYVPLPRRSQSNHGAESAHLPLTAGVPKRGPCPAVTRWCRMP